MKKLLFILGSLSGLSFAQNTILDTLTIDGLERNYYLYVPAAYDGTTAVPLVINLHGYGSNAAQQNLYGDFKPLADQDNFLVVCPNGTLDLSGTPYWNAFVNAGAVDDVSFIDQLIDSLSLTYNINQSKVFATGMSNGGFMSYKLACELNNRIAKIASVTGTLNTNLISTCSPGRAISVMQIHGTSDATVPYNGNAAFVPIDEVIDYWVANNNCDTTPIYTALPNINTSDNSTVELFVYPNGTNETEVILYKITGGGHTWPGAIFDLPGANTNKDFSASRVIWEFFKGENISSIQNHILSKGLHVQMFPNHLNLSLEKGLSFKQAKIYNALGQELISEKSLEISTLGLASGVYYLLVETKEGFLQYTFIK